MGSKILVIINNNNNNSFDYIKPDYIKSIDLSGNLFELINLYDIIIISGGPQHLTCDKIEFYPEIQLQIQIVYLCKILNKVLIGICLGCQIIAYSFGLKIISLNNLCIGTGHLDKKTIKYDSFISKLNYDLLKSAFSYHYDYICFIENNEIDLIAESNNKIPYIIKHKKSNIYGFQSHPETNIINIKKICNNINEYSEQIAIDFFNSILNHFKHTIK
jgi:anthranilate/para-aminobenzoate synthase component II